MALWYARWPAPSPRAHASAHHDATATSHRYALWTRERRQASSYGADGLGGLGGYGGVGGYAGPLALRSPARRGAAHDKWLLTMKERYGHSGSSSSSLYGSGSGGAGGWGAYSGSEATSPYESSQRRTSLHSEATTGPYESSQRRTSAVAGAEYSSSLSGKGTSRLCSPPPRTSLASGSSSTIPPTYRSPLDAQRRPANLPQWEAAPVTAPYSVSAGCTIRRSGAAPGAATRAETPAEARDHERDLGRDYGRDRARSGRDYEVLGDGAEITRCSLGGGRAAAPGAGGDGDGYGDGATATGAAPPPGRSARRSPTREESMEQSGTLYARLVLATGLKSVDSDGPSDIHSGHSQSDPYVRLSLGERTHRSKTCKKTNDPVWEETFMFKGTLRELLAEPLQLQVMTDG